MSFTTTPVNEHTAIVRIENALDFRNAGVFKETWQNHVDAGFRNFIIDFSGTEFLDSTGLGAIFSLYRRVASNNGQVAFASVSHPVRTVVHLTRTYKVFDQFPSVEAAQEAMG